MILFQNIIFLPILFIISSFLKRVIDNYPIKIKNKKKKYNYSLLLGLI